jgi:hypothetical protein
MSFPMSNTKIFNNVQDLWSYCEKCIICHNFRRISFTVGPDEVFDSIPGSFNFIREYQNLYINFAAYLTINDDRFRTEFNINGAENTFDFQLFPVDKLAKGDGVYKSSEPYLFFYLNANCPECNYHTTSTADIELDLNFKTISNIALESEIIYFTEDDKCFEFEIDHIKRCIDIVDYTRKFGRSKPGKKIKNVPFVDYDFSDRKKLLKKIQTIITFG